MEHNKQLTSEANGERSGFPPGTRGVTLLRRSPFLRTVEGMTKFFDSSTGLRRGPRRIFAGIGGGIAEKLGLNVWVARLLILVSFLLPVLGIGAYLVVWILTPWQDGRIPLEQVFGSRSAPRR